MDTLQLGSGAVWKSTAIVMCTAVVQWKGLFSVSVLWGSNNSSLDPVASTALVWWGLGFRYGCPALTEQEETDSDTSMPPKYLTNY